MGGWHDTPGAYPHHCVQCERATLETGPFHRGSTITVAVRGGLGEVPYTLWTCRACMQTALHAVLSPFKTWGPPGVPETAAAPAPVEGPVRDAAVFIGKLRDLLEEFGDPVDEPVKRGPGRPRKVAA